MKICMESLLKNKIKLEIPFDTAVPLLCIFQKKLMTSYYSDICIFIVIATEFIIIKSCPSTDE